MKCDVESFSSSRTGASRLFVLMAAALAFAAFASAQDSNKLVYADFETMKDNRPVSNRGGFVQLTSYQERPTMPSVVKGMAGANPPAPELVRLKKDDPNHAAAFDFELKSPNDYAGVAIEIHGQPDQDGHPQADDVSNYKYLTLQAYATGVPELRLELISHGYGIELSSGYPQTNFKVRPGFNTYRIPLKSLGQPSWAQPQVSTKDVLRKLTAVSIAAYCEKCAPTKGTIVIDNLVFQN